MKKFIRIFLLFTLAVFYSCSKGDISQDKASEPSIANLQISELSSSSVQLSATVTDDGGSTVVKRGFRLSKNSLTKPTDDWDIDYSCGDGVGDFSKTIKGLEENTTYYYMAYASNKDCSEYTNILSFRTFADGKGNLVALNTPVVTSMTYSADGFDDGVGNKYKYKMSYNVEVNIFDYSKISRVGYKIADQSWYMDNPTGNNTFSQSMTTMSNTSTISVTLTAFAIMKDGTEYTGNTKTVSATYKGSTTGGTGGNTGEGTSKYKRADYTSAKTSYSGGHSIFSTYESMASHLNSYGLFIYKNGNSYYWTDFKNVRHTVVANYNYSNQIYASDLQVGNASNNYQIRKAYIYVSFRFAPF